MSSTDRHKLSREYQSGAAKRKKSKQQFEKHAAVASKSRRITEFAFSVPPSDTIDFGQIQPTSLIFQNEAGAEVSSCSSELCTKVPDEKDGSDSENSDDDISVTVSTDTNPEHQPLSTHSDSGSVVAPTDQLPSQLRSANNSTGNVDDNNVNQMQLVISDVALWPDNPTKKFIDYWVLNGHSEIDIRHCDEQLINKNSVQKQVGDSSRRCTKQMFYRRLKNGESAYRSWLCFSPSQGTVYCYVCKLMSKIRSQLTHGGFDDWYHASARLGEHEQSKHHVEAVLECARRAEELGSIEHDLAKQISTVVTYWRNALKRIVSVIKFICERGLAFRGSNETFGSAENGNYLGILELLAQYDDFLAEHIKKHGNQGSGHANYLSSTVCDELIMIIGQRVLSEIISRIKESKYYSISLDSTPDESHIDQLTLVFRYMENSAPVERFVTFMPNRGHKAAEMFKALHDFLQKYSINIADCRGQSYDNASSMSGKYSGLRALVQNSNPLAEWVPCTAHSLNLVGKTAAECCSAAVAFFDLLQQVYTFFTASTHRYEVLTQTLKSSAVPLYVPKKLSETRWSCRYDACKAFSTGYNLIQAALELLVVNEDEKAIVRSQAEGLSSRMSSLETGIYAAFWHEILERFNATSKALQDPQVDLNTAVASLQSLRSFVDSKRNSFDDYEAQGKAMSGMNQYVEVLNRQRRSNVRLIPLDYGQAPPAELTPRERFRVESFLPVIDQILVSLDQRITAYSVVNERFGFIRQLDKMSTNDIKHAAAKLVETYNSDLEDSLSNELVQLVDLCKEHADFVTIDTGISREQLLYKFIVDKHLVDTFPNVAIALRMYLVLMVANSSSERSFSKLKLIKNRLRTTMTQQRLSDLSLLSIETDILREMDCSGIIDEFANRKARKVNF